MPPRHIAQPRQVLASLAGGLVVSCRARPGNPLHGPATTAQLARAAELGGARGIRINGTADFTAVRGVTSLPIIAINRERHVDSPVEITPTVVTAIELLDAGATIIALDATARPRPNGEHLAEIVTAIHAGGATAMGDLASTGDLAIAMDADVDAVGTTLSVSTAPEEPDFGLLTWLVKHSPVPVYAAGRYWTPDQVVRAFELGASFVVVGTAITNPMAITSRFARAIEQSGRGRPTP